MIILKNIKKTSSTISADYYPEGKEPKWFMEIKMSAAAVVKHDNASSFAALHVKQELK